MAVVVAGLWFYVAMVVYLLAEKIFKWEGR